MIVRHIVAKRRTKKKPLHLLCLRVPLACACILLAVCLQDVGDPDPSRRSRWRSWKFVAQERCLAPLAPWKPCATRRSFCGHHILRVLGDGKNLRMLALLRVVRFCTTLSFLLRRRCTPTTRYTWTHPVRPMAGLRSSSSVK